MTFWTFILFFCTTFDHSLAQHTLSPQAYLHPPDAEHHSISASQYAALEEASRLVDVAYCVGAAGPGIQVPFLCNSWCQDFPNIELNRTWNTGLLLTDSCGYLAVAHPSASAPSTASSSTLRSTSSEGRIILSFRGTYSLANTIIDLSSTPQSYIPYPSTPSTSQVTARPDHPKCHNCTVHGGFLRSTQLTIPLILPYLQGLLAAYPNYTLSLLGHSLGGAVACLSALDLAARGFPIAQIITFGEPRVGNLPMSKYIDEMFPHAYTRITHIGDPVPLLPPGEEADPSHDSDDKDGESCGYASHGSEIFILSPDLPPKLADLRICQGRRDVRCSAGRSASSVKPEQPVRIGPSIAEDRINRRSLGVVEESGVLPWFPKGPLFSHRDYFHRLGLCIPGGDPGGIISRVDEL